MPIWQPVFSDPADATAEMTPHRLLDAACSRHRDIFGTEPTGGATAPSTWSLLGEHTDHSGGIVLASLSQWSVAVTVSPNPDDVINVATVTPLTTVTPVTGGEMDVEKHSLAVDEVAARAAAQQTTVNAHGRPSPTPVPEGGIAARLGGLAWTMIHRQMLSRDTRGLDITVVSTIPVGIGLGEMAATDVATALALFTEDTRDAPIRARLAEICSQSAAMFAEIAPLRARHTTALRGERGKMSVIDYADGSVTQVPHPVNRSAGLSAYLVAPPTTGVFPTGDLDPQETRRRQYFVDEATRAFSVESLRLLPDATVRVTEWLEAVIEVAGRKHLPTVEQARNWLSFWEAETMRAQRLTRALRARRRQDIAHLVGTSQNDLSCVYGVPDIERALVELCQTRGAVCARSASAGITRGVVALVDARRATNFAADLADDGLLVVPLGHGEVADKAF